MSDLKRPASPHPDQRPSKVLNTSDQPSVDAIAASSTVASTFKTTDPRNIPKGSLLIKRLNENGRLPTRGSALAAGYDLYRSVSSSVVSGNGLME